jgi:hypothetical protein
MISKDLASPLPFFAFFRSRTPPVRPKIAFKEERSENVLRL